MTARFKRFILLAEMRTGSNFLEENLNAMPGVRCWGDNAAGQLRGQEFWLRSVTAHPQDRYPNERWSFWQYSGTGLVPGVRGTVDLNAFAGSESDWVRWLSSRRQG